MQTKAPVARKSPEGQDSGSVSDFPQVFGHSSALFAVLSVAILGVPGAPPASVSLAVRAKRALQSTDVAAPLSQ